MSAALLSLLLTASAASVLLPWAARRADGFSVGLALVGLLILATPAMGHTLLGRADPGGFGTLGLGARLGLMALSAALFLGLLWIAALKTRWLAGLSFAPLLDSIARALLALAAIMLSAQLYYAYYRLIIPSLPAQVVIAWPGWDDIADLLSIWQDGPLGQRLRGAVFWAVTLAGPLSHWLARAEPRPPSRALSALFGGVLAAGLHGLGQ